MTVTMTWNRSSTLPQRRVVEKRLGEDSLVAHHIMQDVRCKHVVSTGGIRRILTQWVPFGAHPVFMATVSDRATHPDLTVVEAVARGADLC